MDTAILHNKDVLLKPIEHADADDLMQLINDCRNYLRPWLPWVDSTNQPGDIMGFLDSITNEIERPYVIMYKQKVAGVIAIKNYDADNSSCEIGYWIGEKFQNRGIACNSCKLLIDYICGTLNIKRIEMGIAVDNVKSKKIPVKLGFHMEGIKKRAEFINNRFLDYEIYSLINEGRETMS